MTVFVFALALILAIGGVGGLIASVDLLPTEIGVLYAGCGVIAVSSACIVASIGVLILRLDRLAPERQPVYAEPPAPLPPMETPEPALEPNADMQGDIQDADYASEDEDRSGRFPTMHEMEEAIAHPEPPPTLVGRYSAGGASYMIFSDGTIEAETSQGAYRFASMGDFKAFIANQKV